MNYSVHLHLSTRVSDQGLPFQLEVAQSLRKSSDPLVQTFQLLEAKPGSFLNLLG